MTTIAAAILAAPLSAQSTPGEAAEEAVGPRELRDFSLPGTTPAPAPPPTEQGEPPAPESPAQNEPVQPAPRASTGERIAQSPPPALQTQPAQADVTDAPLDARTQPQIIAPVPSRESPYISQPTPEPVPPAPIAPEAPPPNNRTMMLWLGVALIGGAAALYALLRRRAKTALENRASLEAFVPAEPPPVPAAVPGITSLEPESASSASKPNGPGLVSARLRPILDLQISPLRGIIDQHEATIEFSVVAFNKGNAPAREVRIEVAMINASPSQDKEIGRFFEEPAGVGEPIDGIAPMSHVNLTSRVSLPIDQVRALEVAGRRLFVPMLAFNAIYKWSGGDGQTSRSYLIGREGGGEKLAPIRLDLGPRIFRNLGARLHHLQVQR